MLLLLSPTWSILSSVCSLFLALRCVAAVGSGRPGILNLLRCLSGKSSSTFSAAPLWPWPWLVPVPWPATGESALWVRDGSLLAVGGPRDDRTAPPPLSDAVPVLAAAAGVVLVRAAGAGLRGTCQLLEFFVGRVYNFES